MDNDPHAMSVSLSGKYDITTDVMCVRCGMRISELGVLSLRNRHRLGTPEKRSFS